MATDYENSTKKVGCVAQQECHEEVCKKAPPSMVTGRCDYYQNRYDNYIERHRFDSKSGGDNPPNYYLNYGFKYCSKFSKETMPKLSPQGKEWLRNTLERLQTFMEAGVVDREWKADINEAYNDYIDKKGGAKKFYTGIECRDSDFTKFAFATHPDAYNPSMFKNLTCQDLITIGATPSDEYMPSGKHKLDTLWQVIYVGEELDRRDDILPILANCMEEGASYLGKKVDEAVDTIEEIFYDFARTVSRGGI